MYMQLYIPCNVQYKFSLKSVLPQAALDRLVDLLDLPSSWVIRYSWSMSDSPGKRGSPDFISANRQPTAQMSTSLKEDVLKSVELFFFQSSPFFS